MLALRDYQQAIIDGVRAEFKRGRRRVLIRLPTGGGKTLTAARMLGGAAENGHISQFTVHRRELLKQASRAFSMHSLDHGFIAAGMTYQPAKPIQICGIDTLRRRMKKGRVERPRFVVIDEAQHSPATTWSEVMASYGDAYVVGLSATPVRTDGQGLGKHFEVIVHGPEKSWLIEQGWLSATRCYAPSIPDLTGVKVTHGEYVRQQLQQAMGQSQITGNAIEQWRKHGRGGKALCFCVSVEHSMAVAGAFKAAGIPAEHVDGETDDDIRDAAMARFRRGETMVLTNVDLFGEGVDVPDASVCIMLRPSCSLGLFLQQAGRIERPVYADGTPLDTGAERVAAIAAGPKPFAVLLDHAGNIMRHGLPDEVHEWSLDGVDTARKKQERALTVKVCKHCYAANPATARACLDCGEPFEIKYRTIDEVAGDLVEVDREKLAAAAANRNWLAKAQTMPRGQDRDLDYLRDLAAKRGHKDGWAHHVWAGKMAKKEMRA